MSGRRCRGGVATHTPEGSRHTLRDKGKSRLIGVVVGEGGVSGVELGEAHNEALGQCQATLRGAQGHVQWRGPRGAMLRPAVGRVEQR